jgi:hypothetical protein
VFLEISGSRNFGGLSQVNSLPSHNQRATMQSKSSLSQKEVKHKTLFVSNDKGAHDVQQKENVALEIQSK